MRNRPLAAYHEPHNADAARGESVMSRLRLSLIAVCFVTPLLAVVGRIAYLQSQTQAAFLEPLQRTTIEEEYIPARDGRILASDGRVLATDRHRFRLAVHYRWLEDPPDPTWLRRTALSRLSRLERRDAAQVDQAIAAVRQQRQRLWERLEQLPSFQNVDIEAERATIQAKVEAIRELVLRRREAKHEPPAPTGDNRLERLWNQFHEALTNPPERYANDPLILQEELDYHAIAAELSFDEAVDVETHPERYPGVVVRVESERQYPLNEVATHVVGVRIAGDGSAGSETVGRTGLEKSYDHILRGQPGLKRLERNRQGEVIRTELVRPPVNGRDIVTAINLDVQQVAEQALDDALQTAAKDGAARGGSVVLIDVHSGAILAAASAPRVDANTLARPTTEQWEQIVDDPRNPLFSRPTQMALPPGSVFKTLSAIALLHAGQIDSEQTLECRGYLDRPTSHRCLIFRHHGIGHGTTTLGSALAESCNVYFFDAARRAGPIPLVQWAKRFGFGQPTGVDLPFEKPGQLPQPPGGGSRSNVKWRPGDTLGLAIGQATLLTTPLQIARLMAAVANDGELVTPHVVTGLGPAWDNTPSTPEQTSFSPPSPVPIEGLDPRHLAEVRNGLTRVVSDPRGTAHASVYLPEVSIAGKTGTAQAGGDRQDHAWFAGYAPAERPRVAFVVVLEHAGSGSTAAGPIAQQLIQSLYGLGLLNTDINLSRQE